MRYGRMFPAACVAFGIALWASASPGADVIVGSALAARGEVFRADAAHQYPLAPQAPVYLGDTIVTGAGKAKIGLNDGTTLSIGENTRLTLSTYQSVSNGFATRLHVWAGVLRLLVARITPGGRFEVESETAIAAVRGTDWMMSVTPDQTGVAVISGAVEVSSLEPPGHFRELHDTISKELAPVPSVMLDTPGLGTDVRRGEPPHPPHPWPAQRFSTMLERCNFE